MKIKEQDFITSIPFKKNKNFLRFLRKTLQAVKTLKVKTNMKKCKYIYISVKMHIYSYIQDKFVFIIKICIKYTFLPKTPDLKGGNLILFILILKLYIFQLNIVYIYTYIYINIIGFPYIKILKFKFLNQ